MCHRGSKSTPILNLLKDLQNECKTVELCDRNEIFKQPIHPYIKALLSAIPIPKPDVNFEKIILKGNVPIISGTN